MTSLVFADRAEAGRLLSEPLLRFKTENPAVFALPRGGVPVGYEVAQALDAPLDLVLVRKIGAPYQPELAVGAVVDGPKAETVLNEEIVRLLQIDESFIAEETAKKREEIAARRQAYLAGRPRTDAAGHTAILVDDGIATGATMRAAIHAINRSGPRKLVVAVPVAPADIFARFADEPAELVCLSTPDAFFAIGQFYRDFHQMSDDEVKEILARAATGRGSRPPAPSQGR